MSECIVKHEQWEGGIFTSIFSSTICHFHKYEAEKDQQTLKENKRETNKKTKGKQWGRQTNYISFELWLITKWWITSSSPWTASTINIFFNAALIINQINGFFLLRFLISSYFDFDLHLKHVKLNFQPQI